MEPKLETIWSGRFLNDVAYSNWNKKMMIYIPVETTNGKTCQFQEMHQMGCLCANIMGYKLETVWSGCLLDDVPYSNSKQS